MTLEPASYPRHRFPAEIISHAVWLYHVFSLSLRDVELILAERGILVTHEGIRHWCLKFGAGFARRRRRRRPQPGDTWHLDEVFIRIRGVLHYLWRAVDEHGVVLDISRTRPSSPSPSAAQTSEVITQLLHECIVHCVSIRPEFVHGPQGIAHVISDIRVFCDGYVRAPLVSTDPSRTSNGPSSANGFNDDILWESYPNSAMPATVAIPCATAIASAPVATTICATAAIAVAAALRVGARRAILAGDHDRARVGPFEPGHHHQQGRFARS